MTESTLTTTGYRWEMTEVAKPLVRSTFDLPTPQAGEALVKIHGCGVCHTDLGFLYDGVKTRAPLPLALGHEISGEVIQAGAGFESLVGRGVIVPAVMPCGKCEACQGGHGTICPKQIMPGNDISGGFASHILVPADGLCKVPEQDGVTTGAKLGASGCDLAMLSVLADAVTTPYQAIMRANVGAGDFVVVIGLGGDGGFAVQIAKALGATVAGFDIAPARLEMLSAHGLDKGIDPTGKDARDLRKELRGVAPSPTRWKIFECSGTKPGQELAWGLLGHGAYLSVVGFTMAKMEVRLSNLMAFDAKASGNWGCLPELYPEALALVLDGKVAVEPFVETHPMDDIQAVIEKAHAHQLRGRAVLMP